MLGVLTGFAIILAVIFTGWILAVKGIIRSDRERLMFNKVAFYAATPALLFSSVATADPGTILSPVTITLVIATVAVAAVYCGIFRRDEVPVMATGAAASGFFNSVNIGFPVSIYVVGEATWVVPMMLIQMIVFTPFILGALGSGGWGSVFKNALLSPVVVASFLGLAVALMGWTVPAPIMEPLSLLGGASIPMILMSFGASLKTSAVLSDRSARPQVFTATALKLVGMPLAAFACATLMGLDEDLVYTAVILAALPTAQNVYNYAATFEKGQTVARDTVFITTFASLPVMLIIALAFGR